ncbi:type I phosphodiesterase/nucleotide pyrophosphatase [Sulfolobus islandicus Y.G.57.14]|uniref:Type I phosphodiesterase/nucleotide pyrophosphatase n=5 Tax=Saccharolobus islandicus TaxID=43080 RepID=C3MK99_SACI2|nr:type I phosphodiesterase/nucleotide pyrophosphatase [Sulfolobus islandicus L.S.2.15]ACP44510.1 type I phosphodiesterase/nucleotide pyrophosphatase [Sulfolobus islandicus Y.G.57.14]ACP49723.1 type I phosphodiesterase/nucleotidepyro phosphatase [Sulfolobus islandicus Y.N.15.51]ADB86017.1 type I phosphodiesterase/nucleotide pyrophosphatase [Sulfolobus islandicus L.D.8.5]
MAVANTVMGNIDINLKINTYNLIANMDLILPDYYGENIYTLSCFIAEYLGVQRQCLNKMNLNVNSKLVLALFDGLGWNIFNRTGINLQATKITSVFPSTTSTVLTTLFTASTPGEHGVLGYNTFSKRLGGIVNTLRYTYPTVSDRDSIRDSVPFSSSFPYVKGYLKEVQGKKAISLVPKGIENTEFSNATHGASGESKTYVNFWDAFYQLSQILQQDAYDFIYFYVPDVDTLSHKYGPYTDPTIKSARDILISILEISEKHKKYSFIITADHGHVPVSETILFNNDQDLLNMLDVPPYGDSRAIFLRTRYDVSIYLSRKYGSLKIFGKSDLERLLGKIKDISAFPDYIAVPTDYRAFIFNFKEKDDYDKLKGHHGGLLQEEFEIPLVILNG